MRGLIYKEFSVFCKSIDKKMLAMAAAAVILLLWQGGRYGGLVASIMFAITISVQNVMSFVSDDRAGWKKYQMAMPVSSFLVVASKYIAVVCTMGISILGSIGLNVLSSVIFHSFEVSVWGFAVFMSVFIPLVWTGVCLPLTYWFGIQSAQAMGMFIIIPVFYLIKYFEDGAGFSAMAESLACYFWAAGMVGVVVFTASMWISVMGYARRK